MLKTNNTLGDVKVSPNIKTEGPLDSFEKQEASWMDVAKFLIGPVSFLLAIAFDYYLNNFFIVIWVAFVILPIIDYILPLDHSSVRPELVRKFEKDYRFNIPLYMVLAADYSVYFYLINGVYSGRIGMSPMNLFIYGFGGAILGMINTTAGHELFHKRQTVHKVFGLLPWFKMFYTQSYMLHLSLHHKFVGTPADPSLPAYNESIFSFWRNTIPRAFLDTFNFESQRLKKVGETSLFS